MVPGIVGWKQTIRLAGVAHHCIEIDYGIEVSCSANPAIHLLEVRFVARGGVVIVGTGVGHNSVDPCSHCGLGCAKNLAYWDITANHFVVKPGTVKVLIGSSSADIRLQKDVVVTQNNQAETSTTQQSLPGGVFCEIDP